MSSPIIEINADGLYLNVERGSLVISKGGDVLGTIPFDDITALLMTSPASTITQQVLIRCAEENIPIIVCGKNYAPIGTYSSCFQHSETRVRIDLQTQASEALKKRLWQKIIQEKIRSQKKALEQIRIPCEEFSTFIDRIRSGDPDNVEAVAAKKYWPKIFGDRFYRSDQDNILNTLLNYGYAVLRACMSRWVVAHGLHPALSVFHQNHKNPFALVDDLMEPYRPYIDLLVKKLHDDDPKINVISPEHKKYLISVLEMPVEMEGENTVINTAIKTFVYTYCQSLTEGTVRLIFPKPTGLVVG